MTRQRWWSPEHRSSSPDNGVDALAELTGLHLGSLHATACGVARSLRRALVRELGASGYPWHLPQATRARCPLPGPDFHRRVPWYPRHTVRYLFTGPAGALEAFGYQYDAAGNRTGDTRNDQTRRYGYDALDQLTQVQRETQRGRWRTEEAFTYDPVGNRLTGLDGEAYTYDAADRLTSDGTFTYSYDANGNLIQQIGLADGAVTSFYYDPENRLTWAWTPTTTVQFRYDALGRRIERTVTQDSGGGEGEGDGEEGPPPRVTRYLYDEEDILATFNRRDRERARYVPPYSLGRPSGEG